ncbi:MAG: TolC family protein [Pirellulales bacterium]
MAESEFYPHLSITGQVGVSAQQFGDLFRNGAGFGNVGPQFRWNILAYGRLMNNVKIQDARFQQAAFNYQQQVLVATQEAEDALVGFLNAQIRLAALNKGVAASEKSSNLVLNLYREGKSDYNRVFNIQTALVQQQDTAAAAAGDVAFQLVQLYRAMGGGWQIRLTHGGGDWCDDCCEKVPLGCEDLFCPKPCPVCPPGELGLCCPNR